MWHEIDRGTYCAINSQFKLKPFSSFTDSTGTNPIGNGRPQMTTEWIIENNENPLLKIWDAMSDAHRDLDIALGDIWRACNGHRITAGGFKWQYVNKK